MFDKLRQIEERYGELNRSLSDPQVIGQPAVYARTAKAASELAETVAKFEEYKGVLARISEARHILTEDTDREMRELAQSEVDELTARQGALEEELRGLLIPRDPNDDKNVFLEIRAGAGGDEAALWAGTLFDMYRHEAERERWKTDVLSASPSDLGGFKEVVLEVKGKEAYARLKHESGVHRVQRVPVTESSGRIHTSTATVAVLAEAEDVEVQIRPEDLKMDVFRSSGPGGQSVNTTDSAVRITHLPTGIVVGSQEERSQLQNREKAMRYLRARLLQQAQQEAAEKESAARKSQVGTGERAEKIRTYNFPENRVTDHRVKLTVHRLQDVLAGDLDAFVEALQNAERAEQLAGEE
jgi:peptide chain release factor 1